MICSRLVTGMRNIHFVWLVWNDQPKVPQPAAGAGWCTLNIDICHSPVRSGIFPKRCKHIRSQW